ncbi:MAG: hypothetical protein JNK85_12735, partial [Verrucomicrobiales bacterium]|nr:hypothetical protein [Verrucomicrobiales bacterium]
MNKLPRRVFYVIIATVFCLCIWRYYKHLLPVQPFEKSLEAVNTGRAELSPAATKAGDRETRPAISVSSEYTGGEHVGDKQLLDGTAYKMLWRTPIVYFGKIVDENRCPIAGVRITYEASSVDEGLRVEVRNEGTVTSDGEGIFEISGIMGRNLSLELFHPLYYVGESNSNGIDYAGELRSGNKVPDSKERATIFVMQRKGTPVALIHRRGGFHRAADGGIGELALIGQSRQSTIGRLQLQAWKSSSDKKNRRFDW